MNFFSLEAERIAENYENFVALCENLEQPGLMKLLDEMGERLMMCPASARVEHHSCFAGGLVDHSLRVFKNAVKLSKSYDMKLSRDESRNLTFSCLFHDLGKVGMPGSDSRGDYYIPQKSSWHAERGMLYEYNREIPYMSVPHRSIYILQYYGVKLEFDVMLAILLNDGQYIEANKEYAMKEPMLSMIVHQSDAFSTLWEKHNLK